MQEKVKDIVILAAALAPPIFTIVIAPAAGLPDWIERSGSLTTILAAVVQFRQLSRSQSAMSNQTMGDTRIGDFVPGTLTRLEQRIGAFSFVVLTIGTVIWGYGSPILHSLQKLMSPN
jgi:hypothetical protein